MLKHMGIDMDIPGRCSPDEDCSSVHAAFDALANTMPAPPIMVMPGNSSNICEIASSLDADQPSGIRFQHLGFTEVPVAPQKGSFWTEDIVAERDTMRLLFHNVKPRDRNLPEQYHQAFNGELVMCFNIQCFSIVRKLLKRLLRREPNNADRLLCLFWFRHLIGMAYLLDCDLLRMKSMLQAMEDCPAVFCVDNQWVRGTLAEGIEGFRGVKSSIYEASEALNYLKVYSRHWLKKLGCEEVAKSLELFNSGDLLKLANQAVAVQDFEGYEASVDAITQSMKVVDLLFENV